MKKFFLFAAMVIATIQLFATSQDTLTYVKTLDEIEVSASVQQVTATHETLSQERLQLTNTGQNLPYLLSLTPSLITTSDDGLGIGYTYFRVRGTDHTRINMTVNDVPLNDQESQTVFWVNMTDIASSLSSLDVQRGVGTSKNGSAAFGASVNMNTLPNLKTPMKSGISVSLNGGMYNTFREMMSADIVLPNNWYMQGRFSKVNSDGYLERASSDLLSYHTALGYNGIKTKVDLSVFGGKEKTYMAWDGVSFEDMQTNPRYNPAGKYTDTTGEIAYYPEQNDYYQQQHTQLHWRQILPASLVLDATLHYTHGNGYYEQYKANKKFTDYGLQPFYDSEGNYHKKSDFIREKHLNNHFAGGIVSLKYLTETIEVQVGAAGNHYIGQHWGNITYVRDSLYPHPLPYDYEFYRSIGRKTDINTYLKANWHIIHKAQEDLSLYGDLQYRYVRYRIDGVNDEDLSQIQIDEVFHFFNPKAGLSYRNHGNLAYFNFAIANREPTRKNYTESGCNNFDENGNLLMPQAERLYDYELGYQYSHPRFTIGCNLYFMDYDNQLVLTGKYSDTGAYLTKNVKNSYRMGAELTAGVEIIKKPMKSGKDNLNFRWDGNVCVSRNKILNYVDWADLYDADWNYIKQVAVDYGTTTIAFSPTVTFASCFSLDVVGFSAQLQTTLVSSQFLDNTASKDAQLPAYSSTNLNMQYQLPLPDRFPNITLRCQINNLFNARYASNGGNWYCIFEDGTRYSTPWVYVQAGINVHAGFMVRF